MNKTLIEMKIQSDPRLLSVVRSAVRRFSGIVGFSDREAHMIALAVDEACTNVICHTYQNCCDREISILFRRLSDGVEIALQDTGPKVDEIELTPRPLDEIKPGGLGLHFMRSIMDQIQYDPDFKEGNRLVMTKWLNPEPIGEPSS